MIWFTIIWLLVGFAGGIHALIAIRRDVEKDYPAYDPKSEPLIEYREDVLIILMGIISGPVSFAITAYTFPRSFFK
jgi:hypothetical protein